MCTFEAVQVHVSTLYSYIVKVYFSLHNVAVKVRYSRVFGSNILISERLQYTYARAHTHIRISLEPRKQLPCWGSNSPVEEAQSVWDRAYILEPKSDSAFASPFPPRISQVKSRLFFFTLRYGNSAFAIPSELSFFKNNEGSQHAYSICLKPFFCVKPVNFSVRPVGENGMYTKHRTHFVLRYKKSYEQKLKTECTQINLP